MYTTQRVGTRGVCVSFDEFKNTKYKMTTNVYIIRTTRYDFVCDTYLGPHAIAPVIDALREKASKEIIVINSHYHWDHVWGNCYFDHSLVIAHTECRKHMLETGAEDLRESAAFQAGPVALTLPNLTITKSLTFEEEGIVIFSSPGHTSDSISVYDRIDNVLFASDNVQAPIPTYMESSDVTTYIKTLQDYVDLNPAYIIPGHDNILGLDELNQNLAYLEDIARGDTKKYEKEPYQLRHSANRNVIAHASPVR